MRFLMTLGLMLLMLLFCVGLIVGLLWGAFFFHKCYPIAFYVTCGGTILFFGLIELVSGVRDTYRDFRGIVDSWFE